jgi:hypothetical protein
VAGDDDAWAIAVEFAEDGAVAIGGEVAAVLEFIDEDGADFVFVAGDGVGIGEFLKERDGFLAHAGVLGKRGKSESRKSESRRSFKSKRGGGEVAERCGEGVV